jgi:hypothetical protein
MLLSIRPITQFVSVNQYYVQETTFKFRSGDAPLLVFRLIDLSVDTAAQNYNPQGRPYFPIFGLTDRMIVSTFMSSGVTAYAVASGNSLTISLTQDLAWSTVPQAGDQLTIPSGSVFAGTGNANVGNYIVVSATSTTITGSTIVNTTAPVNVGTPSSPITFSATPSNDIQDFSYSSVLSCSIMNVQNNLNIVRFANQLAPQIDPSIWGLQIFPGDGTSLAGTNDLYITLYQGQLVTQGYAKSVISVQPVTTAFANVPLNQGYGSISSF